MKRLITAVIGFIFILCSTNLGAEPPSAADRFWPQWRGPSGNGFAADNDPPVEWGETKNVKWKLAIPGKGSSSPIIWGDRLYITTAVPTEETVTPEPAPTSGGGRGMRVTKPSAVLKFDVIAVDRQSGKILWQKTVRKELPHEGTHPTGTWASNSAVTDGQHVFAYFGSRGLYALDMDGNVAWERDFGDMTKKMAFGEGSSPALFGDKIVILWDHEGPSFIVAVDKTTGKDIWKVDREEQTSWSTPHIVENGGIHQVITNATSRIRSYDLEDGRLIWEASGMTANALPTPVTLDGIAILMSGFRGNSLLAIRLKDAQGDISDSEAILWRLDRDTPYTPSPLLYEETLYFLKSNSNILSSFNAKTGEEYYGQQRLEGIGTVYSSPVGAAGRVYITDREGSTLVIRHGQQFEVLATNSLDDGFDASPAIVDDHIYLRGHQNLYCIVKEE